MRSFFIILTALFLVSCSKVPAGFVGIKVNLLGGEKGVDVEELGVGRYYIGINEELYLFPTFQQNYVWTADEREGSENDESFTFQTKEGLEVSADIGITYSVDNTKTSTLFSKYRKGIDEITDTFLRNYVRDAFNKQASSMSVESVYGIGKNALLTSVQKEVAEQVRDQGILVEKIYLVGSFRLPPTVINALNRKIEATQRAEQRENELRESEADAKKRIAEAEGRAKVKIEMAKAQAQSVLLQAEAEAKSRLIQASAEAEANRKLAKSIDSKLIKYEQMKRWDGKMPKFMGNSNSSFLIEAK